MAHRPIRSSFSLSRRLSERARAATPEDSATTAHGLVGLGDMIDALRGLVDRLAEAGPPSAGETESDTQAGTTAHRFSIGGQSARMVFGYTLRMGEAGISAERFGDVPDQAEASGPAAPAARQPIAEIFEEEDTIVVVAELPGADPARIACKVANGSLLIEASGARRYRKSMELPGRVSAEGLRSSFQNGILEVRLLREAEI